MSGSNRASAIGQRSQSLGWASASVSFAASETRPPAFEEYCSGTPQRHVNPYRHFTLDLTQRLLLSLTQIA
jgi:hypothetical protein